MKSGQDSPINNMGDNQLAGKDRVVTATPSVRKTKTRHNLATGKQQNSWLAKQPVT